MTLSSIEKRTAGDILSRITNDVDRRRTFIQRNATDVRFLDI